MLLCISPLIFVTKIAKLPSLFEEDRGSWDDGVPQCDLTNLYFSSLSPDSVCEMSEINC